MSVAEHTASTLVVRHQPWLEWLVGLLFLGGGVWPLLSGERVFGAGFMAAGAVLLLVFANVVTTRFDRGTGRVTRSTRGVIRNSAVTHALDQITGVRVEAANSAGSPSRSYRVVLVLRSRERVPIASGYSSGKADKERLAAEIRRFLELPDAPEAGDFGFADMVKQLR